MNVEILFMVGGKLSKAAAEYLGLIRSLDAKVDKLLHADLLAGNRLIEQAASSNQPSPLLQEAGHRFTDALGLVDGPELASAYLGLAMCKWHLGDAHNAQSVLREFVNTEYTDMKSQTFDKVAKSSAVFGVSTIIVAIIIVIVSIIISVVTVLGGFIVIPIMFALLRELFKENKTKRGKPIESPAPTSSAALTLPRLDKPWIKSAREAKYKSLQLEAESVLESLTRHIQSQSIDSVDPNTI